MIKFWLLAFATLLLFLNLREYKDLFTSQEKLQKKLEKQLSEVPIHMIGKDRFQSLATSILAVLASINILFIVTVVIVIKTPFAILLSALMLTKTVKTFINVRAALLTGAIPKQSVLDRIFVPIETIYIGYFIYFVITKM